MSGFVALTHLKVDLRASALKEKPLGLGFVVVRQRGIHVMMRRGPVGCVAGWAYFDFVSRNERRARLASRRGYGTPTYAAAAEDRAG